MRRTLHRWQASLSPKRMIEDLQQRRTEAFFGLPHHALQPIVSYIAHHTSPHDQALCTSAEQALGLACGHFTATGKTPCVYASEEALLDLALPLHRYGLCATTAATPRLSCLMLLLGNRSTREDPVTTETLDKMGIAHQRLSEAAPWATALDEAYAHLARKNGAFAVLLDATLVEPYRSTAAPANAIEGLALSLPAVAEQLARQVNAQDLVVCTSTGGLAATLRTVRRDAGHDEARTFCIPAGGDVASVAAGLALGSPDAVVYGVQTDGDAVCRLGVFAAQAQLTAGQPITATGSTGPLSNLRHVVVSAGVYLRDGVPRSTGLATPAFDASIAGIAKASGCALVREEPVLEMGELVGALGEMRHTPGPCLLEVVVTAPQLQTQQEDC